MQLLILEDEPPAVRHLRQLIQRTDAISAGATIIAIDSVSKAVQFLRKAPDLDLIFADIQLADGISFDIFEQVEVHTPIVFTTAYDQYILDAFRLNSIDYLLKPIEQQALSRAIHKFQKHWQPRVLPVELLRQVRRELGSASYKERFLIRHGQQLGYIKRQEISCFFAEDGLVFAQLWSGKRHHIDYSLDQLEEVLPPAIFFRVSRKVLIHLDSISRIQPYFSGRLLLELKPPVDFTVTVSRDRVSQFKLWLDQ